MDHTGVPTRSPFGDLLISLRTVRGLTQDGLANSVRSGRISPRSITNYEKKTALPRDWILPHRPALALLSSAMNLDDVDHRSFVLAWESSRARKAARNVHPASSGFLLTGREQLVEETLQAWDRARAGVPQFVLMEGIAGNGKTTLATYLCDSIAAHTDAVMISWGTTGSWAFAVEPYYAIRSATDHILTIPDPSTSLPGDYPSRPKLNAADAQHIINAIPSLAGSLMSFRALREFLLGQGYDDPEYLDSLLSVNTDAAIAGRLDDYTNLILQLSQSWPLVLVLDDMHWSADVAAAMLIHLASRLRSMTNTPIMIVILYRPEALAHDHGSEASPFRSVIDTISPMPHVTHLSLGTAMQPTNGKAFLAAYLQQQMSVAVAENHDTVQWLYDKTSAHPLLASEMVASLRESGALRIDDSGSAVVLHHDLIPVDLPSSISMLMQQKLDSLPSFQRQIVEIASVQGDAVVPAIIADILGVSEDDVTEAVRDQLIAVHQLLIAREPLEVDRKQHEIYRFAQGVFREHVYSQLGIQKRQRYHVHIARYIDTRYAGNHSGAISAVARHYAAGGLWPEAHASGLRLALLAIDQRDWELAGTWFQQAEHFAIQASNPRQLWYTRSARLAYLRGSQQYALAFDRGDEILRVATDHDWPETVASTNFYLGEIHFDLGNLAETERYITEAARLFAELQDSKALLNAQVMLCHNAYRQGRYDVALQHGRKALQINQQLQDTWEQPDIMLAIANCHVDLGMLELAIQDYAIIEEMAVMLGKPILRILAQSNSSLCHSKLQQPNEALEAINKVLDVDTRPLYSQRHLSHAHFYQGLAREVGRNWEGAEASYEQSATIRANIGNMATMCDSLAGLLRMAIVRKQRAVILSRLNDLLGCGDAHDWDGFEEAALVFLSVALGYEALADMVNYKRWILKGYDLVVGRANMIADPVARKSYLTNVVSNQVILERYAQLSGVEERELNPSFLSWP